jgi:hypothetical protein
MTNPQTLEEIVFLDRIKRYPKLKGRMESILNLVENKEGDLIKANDAEKRARDELRKLGNEVLHDWALNRIVPSTEALQAKENHLERNGKKKLKWHTTFGEIKIDEPLFRQPGKQFRPFSNEAEILNRSCSMPLQRVVTDLGADHAFGRVPKKLQEHYGIELPVSTIRTITQSHAISMCECHQCVQEIPKDPGCEVMIAETDGSMIPIVTINEASQDKRKSKKLGWKEARLSLAHEFGSVIPKFGAIFIGQVDDVGQSLLNCAIEAGFGRKTYLHAVGDGAPWIANQVSKKFASQGSYLIDFYHICEYLEAAAKSCAFDSKNTWISTQKAHLKGNAYQKVIDNLQPHLEPDKVENNQAPVRACYRYLVNRTDQLDYKTAIEKGLPIGSGEIESAHRYVIQERLKLPGAWWKAANADSMLALRVVRANEKWNDYWEKKYPAKVG